MEMEMEMETPCKLELRRDRSPECCRRGSGRLASGQGQQRAVQYEGGSGVRVSRWCLQTGGVCVVDDSSSQQRRRRRKTDGGDLRDGNGRREREQRQQQRGS
jgi:hypothetical protein